MSASEVRDFYSLLMLLPLGLVLGTAFLFILLALRWTRHKNAPTSFFTSDDPLSAPGHRHQISPSIFEQPARWLAIKGTNSSLVQTALGLNDPVPCSVEDGLIEARDHKMFISPPISGWILVIGFALPDPADDVDECFHFLRELSRKVGQVQFFSANRVLNHHAWALVDQGHVFRAYAWAGETVWNQGPVTAAEKELRLRCFAYATDRTPFSHKESFVSNADKINRLAARWSVDPGALPESNWNARLGIVGSFSQSKLH